MTKTPATRFPVTDENHAPALDIVTSDPLSVDYRLLAHFEASHERMENARRALPEHWRADPRPEAKISELQVLKAVSAVSFIVNLTCEENRR